MKPKLLLPSYFKIIGIFLTGVGLVLWYLFTFQNREIPFLRYGKNELFNRGAGTYTDELYITLCILGLILVGFSKLKHESIITHTFRLNALYSSVLINCISVPLFLLIAGFADKSKIPALEELSTVCAHLFFYYPFTLLLIFIIRFKYLLYRQKTNAVV